MSQKASIPWHLSASFCFIFLNIFSGTAIANTMSPPLTTIDKWTVFFNGLTAIGTISVALLAIFGQSIRSYLIKPDLSFDIGDKAPLLDVITEDSRESGSLNSNTKHVLRLKITNKGREAARRCKVICECVHKNREQGSSYYEFKKYVPKEFFWKDDEPSKDIVPNIPVYLDIAEIKEPSELVNANANLSQEATHYALHLMIEADGIKGRPLKLNCGKFVIPIIVHADNIKNPIMRFVEILWTGSSSDQVGPEKFSVRLLKESPLR